MYAKVMLIPAKPEVVKVVEPARQEQVVLKMDKESALLVYHLLGSVGGANPVREKAGKLYREMEKLPFIKAADPFHFTCDGKAYTFSTLYPNEHFQLRSRGF